MVSGPYSGSGSDSGRGCGNGNGSGSDFGVTSCGSHIDAVPGMR